MSMDSHETIDICRPRSESALFMFYCSGGQPPSIEDVRHIGISESVGSNEMYSDGQPPSVSDVSGRKPSSKTSCDGYESSDSDEVQSELREINPELLQAWADLPATETHVPEATPIRCYYRRTQSGPMTIGG
ncbi:hypothetical protein LXL04_012610 [Taraxacum kok-saghyz]